MHFLAAMLMRPTIALARLLAAASLVLVLGAVRLEDLALGLLGDGGAASLQRLDGGLHGGMHFLAAMLMRWWRAMVVILVVRTAAVKVMLAVVVGGLGAISSRECEDSEEGKGVLLHAAEAAAGVGEYI